MNILKTLSGKLKKKGQEPTEYQNVILGGLQSKPVWEGNTDYQDKLRRRRANKVARRSRMINARRRRD
jgi:hypothetical protein